MREEDRIVGCMVHNDRLTFWLNRRAGSPDKPEEYEGIRLYWTPDDLPALRKRLLKLGFRVSDIEDREYGQTEFFVTDEDGFSHCFGLPTTRNG